MARFDRSIELQPRGTPGNIYALCSERSVDYKRDNNMHSPFCIGVNRSSRFPVVIFYIGTSMTFEYYLYNGLDGQADGLWCDSEIIHTLCRFK